MGRFTDTPVQFLQQEGIIPSQVEIYLFRIKIMDIIIITDMKKMFR